MPRLRYEKAPEICQALRIILDSGIFPHIDPDRIYCIRSYGSRGRSIARIYGLPGPWVFVLGGNPGYVIEVIHESFDNLSPTGKIEVLIHELLHIPSTFSGALRPHGKYVNSRAVRRLLRDLQRKHSHLYKEALRILGASPQQPSG